MVKICQILLTGTDMTKLERGIIELGANKIIIFTPNTDKHYALARKVVNKYKEIADTNVVPILDKDTFTFLYEFKRILAENFQDYEIKVNASTNVRNWKLLAYFATVQFYPYLKEQSDRRILFYEVVAGPSLTLEQVKYQKKMDPREMLAEDDGSRDIEADQLSSKDVLESEDVQFFDDGWGKPEKRPPARLEIYPIESLTSTEQYIVDIIARQEITIEQIKTEYAILTGKTVTDGLLSRYLGDLRAKALVSERREGRKKIFYLTSYGLKYVLPIIKDEKNQPDPYAS